MDQRQARINKRFRLLYYSILIIALGMLGVVFIREYFLLKHNINFFNEQLIEDARENIKIEVDARVDEISGVQEEIYLEMITCLEDQVKQMDISSMNAIDELIPLASIEDKRDLYIHMAQQFNINDLGSKFFIIDTTGLSYLSGLVKDIEGTDISNLQDEITGAFFIQEMIDTVVNSETNDGIVSYYWIKEVGGDHILKTSYLYYNQNLDLILGAGMYDIDYVATVQEELFTRISDYEYSEVDYIYIIGFDGDVIYHISEEFSKEDVLAIRTTNDLVWHDTIIDSLETNEFIYIDYHFNFIGKDETKTGYIRRIDDWNMYIGRSFIHKDLLIEQDEYVQSIVLGFIIYNISILIIVSGVVLIIRKFLINSIKDVEDEFGEQNQIIKQMSYKDQLTNLYNRTYFVDVIKDYQPCPKGLGLVMADADGLKLINDAYGHNVGDLVLKSVASTLTEVFKDGKIFRWGGDEFIVVISDISAESLELLSNEFKEKIAKKRINHIRLSASLGYTHAVACDDDIYKLINKAEEMMYDHKIFSSSSVKSRMISGLLDTLYDNYHFEKQHAHNVEKYARMMGESLGLSENELQKLSLASTLHDIGKISIPGYLLTKTDQLTDDEFEEIKLHSEKGYRILSAYSELAEYAKYVLSHHERWDGKGYPRGLSKSDIPLYSRIICIADAFDAMTQDRVYKKKISKAEAIEELLRCKGTQFDPELVDLFVDRINTKKRKQ